MNSLKKKLLEQLEDERLKGYITREGAERFPYKSQKDKKSIGDKKTIGAGHLITDEEEKTGKIYGYDFSQGLDENQIVDILRKDLEKHDKETDKVLEKSGIDKSKLSQDQLEALREMGFQLGPSTMSTFKKTLNYIKDEEYEKAAEEAQNSNWYNQTKNRVEEFQKRIIKRKEISRSPAGSVMNTPQEELTPEEVEKLKLQKQLEEEEKQRQIQAAKEQIVIEQTAKDVAEKPELVAQAVKKEENLRPEQKEDIVIQSRNPAAVQQSAANNFYGEKKSGLKDQFMDALTYFGPQILAGLYGQAQEGDAGMVASMDVAGKMRDSYLNYNLQRRDRELREEQMNRGPSEYQLRSLDARERDIALKEKGEERRGKSFEYKQGEDIATRKEKMVKNFNSDKQMSAAKDSIIAAEKASTILETNGKLAPSVMGRLLARMAGEVGVMTDQDVQAFKGSQKWTDQMERWYNAGINGTLTEIDKKEMRVMIEELRESSEESINGWAETQAMQSAEYSGLDAGEIKKMLLPKSAKNLFKQTGKSGEIKAPQKRTRASYEDAVKNAKSVEELEKIKKIYGVKE